MKKLTAKVLYILFVVGILSSCMEEELIAPSTTSTQTPPSSGADDDDFVNNLGRNGSSPEETERPKKEDKNSD